MSNSEQITAVGRGVLVLAPAKINLSLLIAGKRPDGYHEIETIMAKVNWYDELLIEPGHKAGIELACKGPCWTPEGKENLVYRACKALLDNCGSKAGVKITLTKTVPPGTGLGSGSSDAAAALIGVDKLLHFGLGQAALAEIAADLGSDVPFFMNGPLALCTGRGEKIAPLRENFDFLAVLIVPDVSVSTEKVYANYRHDAILYEKLSAQIKACVEKNRIDLVCGMCANMLESSCFGLFKELGELKARIESLQIGHVCLSGSGSAMFLILDKGDAKKAQEIKGRLQDKVGCNTVIVGNNRW